MANRTDYSANYDAEMAKQKLAEEARKRQAKAAGTDETKTTTPSKDSSLTTGAKAATSQLAKGGTGTENVLSAASGGLIASGNPYAMAGGLALGVLGSGMAADRAEAAEAQKRKELEESRAIAAKNTLITTLQAYGSGIVV